MVFLFSFHYYWSYRFCSPLSLLPILSNFTLLIFLIHSLIFFLLPLIPFLLLLIRYHDAKTNTYNTSSLLAFLLFCSSSSTYFTFLLQFPRFLLYLKLFVFFLYKFVVPSSLLFFLLLLLLLCFSTTLFFSQSPEAHLPLLFTLSAFHLPPLPINILSHLSPTYYSGSLRNS